MLLLWANNIICVPSSHSPCVHVLPILCIQFSLRHLCLCKFSPRLKRSKRSNFALLPRSTTPFSLITI